MNMLALLPGMQGPWEIGIILIVIVVLFGNRLPGAAKSLGQSFTAFKKGIKEGVDDDKESAEQI